jgi:hypothetical protein
MDLITVTSMPRSSATEQASEGASHRALVAAASRVLSTGDRPDRAAFLARALNGLADVVPALGARTLDEATHAVSDYQALLDAVNSPEVATAWQVSDPFAAARQRAVELKRQLLEAEGGALTVAEVAKRLGISKQAVDKRRRARKRRIEQGTAERRPRTGQGPAQAGHVHSPRRSARPRLSAVEILAVCRRLTARIQRAAR